MQHMMLFDNVAARKVCRSTIDTSTFPGLWVNTNWQTQGIAKMIIAVTEGELRAHTYGAGPMGLVDWGTVKGASLYCQGSDSGIASAFRIRYDFGFMETRLEGNVNRGVLVLAAYNKFKDGSGRLNYFSREYLSRQTAGGEVD